MKKHSNISFKQSCYYFLLFVLTEHCCTCPYGMVYKDNRCAQMDECECLHGDGLVNVSVHAYVKLANSQSFARNYR